MTARRGGWWPPSIKLPVARGIILIGLTGLAFLLTLITVIDVAGSTDDFLGADVSTGIGTWLGLLVSIAAVVLAVLTFQAERGRAVAA